MTLSRAWHVAWCQVRAADPSFHGSIYSSWPSWPLSYPSKWLPCLHSLVILGKQNTLAHLCNFQERFLNIEMFVNLPSPTCFNGVLGFGNQSPSWVILGTSLGLNLSLCKRIWSGAGYLKLHITKDIIWYNKWFQAPFNFLLKMCGQQGWVNGIHLLNKANVPGGSLLFLDGPQTPLNLLIENCYLAYT